MLDTLQGIFSRERFFLKKLFLKSLRGDYRYGDNRKIYFERRAVLIFFEQKHVAKRKRDNYAVYIKGVVVNFVLKLEYVSNYLKEKLQNLFFKISDDFQQYFVPLKISRIREKWVFQFFFQVDFYRILVTIPKSPHAVLQTE